MELHESRRLNESLDYNFLHVWWVRIYQVTEPAEFFHLFSIWDMNELTDKDPVYKAALNKAFYLGPPDQYELKSYGCYITPAYGSD